MSSLNLVMSYKIIRTRWFFLRRCLIPLFVILTLFVVIYMIRLRIQPQVYGEANIPLKPDSERLIFVGGHESSGTGLLRILLDVHPMIRCGPEPMVTLDILHLRHSMHGLRRQKSIKAGIYPEAYDQAVANFILTIIERMGPSAEYLCHKQPMTFNYLSYLAYLFPNAKFIHILRDPRAVIHSTITRAVNPLYRRGHLDEAMRLWEHTVIPILRDCQDIGEERCLSIRYETLVLKPEQELQRLYEFLQIPWNSVVLKHHLALANVSRLNPYEPSTKQIVQPINTDSLTKWADDNSVLDQEFLDTAVQQSHLLRLLGYAEVGFPPNYENMSDTIPYID